MDCMSLWPNEIRYSHSTMGARFYDGTKVTQTFSQLLQGALTPEDIPPIHVLAMWGKYYAMTGNKRLRMYKRLQAAGLLNGTVPVVRLHSLPGPFSRVFTTETDGRFIEHSVHLNAAFWSLIAEFSGGNDAHAHAPLSPLPCHTVMNILQSVQADAPAQKETEVKQRLRFSPRQIWQIERATRGQFDNFLFGLFRRGRLTSTCFHAALTCIENGVAPSNNLMNAIMLADQDANQAQAYGTEHEEEGITWYEQVNGVRVHRRGIYLHTSGMLGASPDGYINKSTVVEVKCPYNARKHGVRALVGRSFFIDEDEEGEYVLNTRHAQGKKYYHQIQGTLYLSRTSTCDLVVWSPRDQITVRVHKDPAWRDNLTRLTRFYENHVIPQLLKAGKWNKSHVAHANMLQVL